MKFPRTTKPAKQSVREWMDSRTHAEEPPPSMEEIRRQLGWYLLPENRGPDQPDED